MGPETITEYDQDNLPTSRQRRRFSPVHIVRGDRNCPSQDDDHNYN